MPFDKKVFGSRLRSLMHEAGDTIYTLAEHLKLKPSTISRYTSGQYVPKAPTLDMMARRYAVNPAWLMGENVEKTVATGNLSTHDIPILGDVAAGMPIWAEQNYEGYTVVGAEEHVDFALRVRGDSMINARIFDGDLVYVRRQPEVLNGEIAVVMVDNEATVKRIYYHPDKVVLKPENSAYTDMIYHKADAHDIAVLGKVIFVKRQIS